MLGSQVTGVVLVWRTQVSAFENGIGKFIILSTIHSQKITFIAPYNNFQHHIITNE